MIKIIGATVLVLIFAISADAQSAHGAAHFTSAPNRYSSASGGGGGGETGGSRTLSHIPPARFGVRNVVGNSADYVPSTYVSYTNAVAEGNAALSTHPSPLGSFQADTSKPANEEVKIEVVQGQDGKPAIRTH